MVTLSIYKVRVRIKTGPVSKRTPSKYISVSHIVRKLTLRAGLYYRLVIFSSQAVSLGYISNIYIFKITSIKNVFAYFMQPNYLIIYLNKMIEMVLFYIYTYIII